MDEGGGDGPDEMGGGNGADKAYGNTPQSPIGPNQAVLFDVKLVSVK